MEKIDIVEMLMNALTTEIRKNKNTSKTLSIRLKYWSHVCKLLTLSILFKTLQDISTKVLF
jgi:hypothetical protein